MRPRHLVLPHTMLDTRTFSLFAAFAAVLSTTGLRSQTPQQTVVPVTAVASASPPSIAFSWPLDPTASSFSVARRLAGASSWGPLGLIPGGGTATTWTDTNVSVGTRYEYWFNKVGNPAGKGFVTAGIEAAVIEDRGRLVLLVDASQVQGLGARLDRLIEDLTGDGWRVLRHDVQRTDSVPNVKALILADVAAHPGEVKAVFLLGHVPVPYSGAINPDGHPDHYGAWPADVFYGELNGNWTDSVVNTTVASRLQNRNIPNDGKYDQSTLPSDVDLAVGRVDLADMPAFALSETALLQQYLDKDHDYRHKVFAADQRAVVDDNFGYFSGEAFAASGWRNFAALVDPQNVTAADYFGTLNAPGNGYVWSYGCGGGSYTSCGGVGSTTNFAASQNRSVFTMLFGSYFGDWDSTDNFLRAPLCSGWTLCDVWAGRPHWSFHPMGLGAAIGECARLSQNDNTVGGYGTRFVHLALMGDPTLRQHVIAPPGQVTVVDLWPQASIGWTPSADAVAGYHVYRAASPSGPFTRLSASAVSGTNFIDPAPLAGESTYMVRALRLETTPSGSYWNLSQGAFATQRLPQLAATHRSYGSGCYTISDSFYQYLPTPAAASAALSGTAITLQPANGGYQVTAGGSFVAPSPAAAVLALGDDAEVAITPSSPVPYPGGSAATLYVHSNGIVGTAPLSLPPASSAAPAVAALLNQPGTAWYSWHDFDPSEPGSGGVVVEEIAGTLYVTWNGVESHPGTVANASAQQFQFDLATGVVRLCWPTLTTVGTGQQTAPSEQWLVGFSPGGASVDAGPLDLATALPHSVGSGNLEALALSASPAPVSTPSSGTLVTWHIDAVPELSPGNRVGVLAFGFTPDLHGTDLAGIGMPGCSAWLGSVELSLLFAGSSAGQGVALMLPAGVPPGAMLYATAIALVPPHSLPNGTNALGAVTSNGVISLVNDH